MKIKHRKPICNNNPSSAPSINGKVFFLCWRCSGVLIGVAIITVLFFFGVIDVSKKMVLQSSILGLPALVDYIGIRVTIFRPSNLRRTITGILLGVPISGVILFFLRMIS